MSEQTSGLTIRQHEREGLGAPVEFIVSDRGGFTSQVRFSATSGSANPHMIGGAAIDISSGGMGLRTRHFVPRMCEGTVRVFASKPSREPELILEQAVKVRRVILLGREPSYSLGVAFLNPGTELDQQIETMLQRTGMQQSPQGAEGRHA